MQGLTQLASDYEAQVSIQGGVRRYHPGRIVSSGNDLIRGDQGADFIVGDHGMLSVAPTAATSAKSFVTESARTYRGLQNLRHLVADLSNVVAHAEQSVTQSPGQQPVDLHELASNNDRIDGSAKASAVTDQDADRIVAWQRAAVRHIFTK